VVPERMGTTKRCLGAPRGAEEMDSCLNKVAVRGRRILDSYAGALESRSYEQSGSISPRSELPTADHPRADAGLFRFGTLARDEPRLLRYLFWPSVFLLFAVAHFPSIASTSSCAAFSACSRAAGSR